MAVDGIPSLKHYSCQLGVINKHTEVLQHCKQKDPKESHSPVIDSLLKVLFLGFVSFPDTMKKRLSGNNCAEEINNTVSSTHLQRGKWRKGENPRNTSQRTEAGKKQLSYLLE